MHLHGALVIGALMAGIGAAQGGDLTIANWNIQTLVYPADPLTVFPGDYRRQHADFADLRRWRDLVGADVYLLQEITSPAAIEAVFPSAEGWRYCISGQYAKDEGLPVSPACTAPGQTPHVPQAAERHQYTAIAIRPNAPVEIVSVADLQSLNVGSLDGGVVRPVRWGLDATLKSGSSQLRLLVVHMKSGCFDDRLTRDDWLEDPAGKAAVGSACTTLGRQLFPLRGWLEAREAAGEAWMVVGDFNRRLDAGAGTFQDEVWTALSGYEPRTDLTTGAIVDKDIRADIALFRSPYKEASVCWREFREPNPTSLESADAYNLLPIEFFVFGERTKSIVVDNSHQIAWPWPQPVDMQRLSDHCPEAIRIKLN
jgi:hypothetical protein